MRPSARLGPPERDAAWQRLPGEVLDVLVIGGGVTGAGAALDAATRGLSVALVEARDLGSGTSSRSSRLIHGGLRYLEQRNVRLVREALRERGLLLTRLAPHLVKPVSFLYPLRHRAWERPYVGAGLVLYDVLGGARSLPRHRHLSRTRARELVPALRRDALIGGIRYYDGLTDDARYALTVARTAAHYGALVRTSSEVVGLLRDDVRVVGAEVRDVETGETTQVRARVVLNCTGVWTNDVQRLSGTPGRFNVRPSKGIHLVVPRDRIDSHTGLILRTETSVLFVIPWGAHWIIGTTDTTWRLEKAHPAANRRDIDYILDHVNRVLAVRLSPADVESVYAGLRPLLAGESDDNSRLSREHAVARPLPGLVAVAGGKYTTYRVMAADVVDAALADLDRHGPSSVTDRIALLGAEGYHALVNQVDDLAVEYGLAPARIRRLLDRYGSLIHEVLGLADDDRSLLDPLPGAEDYLKAEIRYGATHEAALHLDDLLTRRTRISVETPHRGTETAPVAADLVADVLGWSTARIDAEVEAYSARVAAERHAQAQPDDETAEVVRLSAPDTRVVAV